ncbi:HutD family protein [Sphingomonas ginsenosidimutans]|uniref:HutD/Ves family protein n=1 Tax=Sphingomonas ginsenosidimutans TaxID=862134 RepID=UPI000DB1A7D9|nr:HutD family protein [Sphingomonas ginsenosidimutans]MBY0302725.1 HutD family protein [Sphingomonas ginsenosidimutans]PZP65987.1 MAG: HutD-family protein [Methylorubrum populi]
MSASVLLPAVARVAVPWKDGGGITRTIAAGPEGAGLDDFDWRLSMAEVRAAGAFSRFEGIDRHLAVLEGELALDIGGQPHGVGRGDAPVTFAGDMPVTGAPVGGDVIDLNLMVRRGRAIGRLAPVTPAFTADPAAHGLILVFTAPGAVDFGGERISAERFDAVRVDPTTWPAIGMDTAGPVFVAEITGPA